MQNRTRSLQQIARHGGMDCVGESTQFRDCNPQACPGKLNVVIFTKLVRLLLKILRHIFSVFNMYSNHFS